MNKPEYNRKGCNELARLVVDRLTEEQRYIMLVTEFEEAFFNSTSMFDYYWKTRMEEKCV